MHLLFLLLGFLLLLFVCLFVCFPVAFLAPLPSGVCGLFRVCVFFFFFPLLPRFPPTSIGYYVVLLASVFFRDFVFVAVAVSVLLPSLPLC